MCKVRRMRKCRNCKANLPTRMFTTELPQVLRPISRQGCAETWPATAVFEMNMTRNIFLETGYRFFYMDRSNDGFTYNAGEYGLFSGIGVKF